MKKFIFTIILLPILMLGQKAELDSLKLALKNAKHDSVKYNIYNHLATLLHQSNPDSAIKLFVNAKQLSEKNLKTLAPSESEYLFFKRSLSEALSNIGFMYNLLGKSAEAIKCCSAALKNIEDIPAAKKNNSDKVSMANVLSSLGILYLDQGNSVIALDMLIRSLRLIETEAQRNKKLEDQIAYANTLHIIGSVYEERGEIDKSMEYNSKSLDIYQRINDARGVSLVLNSIASVFKKKGELRKSLAYYHKALNLLLDFNNSKENVPDMVGLASTLNNIGSIHQSLGEDNKALEYYNKSLLLLSEMQDQKGLAYLLKNISEIYFNQKKVKEAIDFANRSLKISQASGYSENIRNAAGTLKDIYKSIGDSKKALEYFELYVQMRDSIAGERSRKASIKQQLKYEYEKQAAADSVAHAKESEVKNVQLQKQSAEIIAKKNQQYALFGGLALLIVFAGFMYNRFKITQKQKYIIEEQKTIVEEQKKVVEQKQKEVLDSIHYAKRIQVAHLPSDKKVESSLTRLQKKA